MGTMLSTPIDYRPPVEGIITLDDVPLIVTLFEVTEHATVIIRLTGGVTRPSDFVSKAFIADFIMRRDNDVAVVKNGGSPYPSWLGAPAEITALQNVNIGMDCSGVNFFMSFTGLAATELHWGFQVFGIQLTDLP